MNAEVKKGNCAIWGPHTEEIGIITKKTATGFYARYKSRFPRENRRGQMEPVWKSRHFENSQIVDCVGFPPNGKVVIRPR